MSLPPPGVRISDSDRERAAERLNQALAEGRIAVAELEERLAAVYDALYPAELRPPLADLPGDDVVAPPGHRTTFATGASRYSTCAACPGRGSVSSSDSAT